MLILSNPVIVFGKSGNDRRELEKLGASDCIFYIVAVVGNVERL